MTLPSDLARVPTPGLLLRPLGMGELLDAAFALYRRLFGPLVTLQVICGLPGLAIVVYGDASGGTALLERGLATAVNLVLGTAGTAATALLIGEMYLGRALTAREALTRVLPFFGTVMTASLLVGLAAATSAVPTLIAFAGAGAMMTTGTPSSVLLGAGLGLAGLAALVLPLWVFSGTSLATISLVLERLTSGMAGVRRSWTLTKNARGRIMALLFLLLTVLSALLIGLSSSYGLVGTVNASGTSPVLTLLLGLASFVLTPIVYCVLTLIYYDRRVRLEGFDLELLAQTLT